MSCDFVLFRCELGNEPVTSMMLPDRPDRSQWRLFFCCRPKLFVFARSIDTVRMEFYQPSDMHAEWECSICTFSHSTLSFNRWLAPKCATGGSMRVVHTTLSRICLTHPPLRASACCRRRCHLSIHLAANKTYNNARTEKRPPGKLLCAGRRHASATRCRRRSPDSTSTFSTL